MLRLREREEKDGGSWQPVRHQVQDVINKAALAASGEFDMDEDMIRQLLDVEDLWEQPQPQTRDPDTLDYLDPDTGMIRVRTPAVTATTEEEDDLMHHRRMLEQQWWSYYTAGDTWKELRAQGYIIYTSNGGGDQGDLLGRLR